MQAQVKEILRTVISMSDQLQDKHLTKKDIRRTALRWQFMTSNAYNYESQQAGGVVFALSKALRKIYKDDEEGYKSSLENHFKFFNTTGPAASLILGATLAMEDREGKKSQPAVQSLKTGLMGPLAVLEIQFSGCYYQQFLVRLLHIWDCKEIQLVPLFG